MGRSTLFALGIMLSACRVTSEEKLPPAKPTSEGTSRSRPPAAALEIPPDAAAPKWFASAARAPGALAQRANQLLVRGPRPRNAADVDAVLDQVAAQAPSAAGLRAAADLLQAAPTKLKDPTWAGSGTAPWALWLHHAGIAILADLAQRSCTSNDDAATIEKTVEALALPPIFNSGGVDGTAMAEQRERLRGAVASCVRSP